MRLKGLLNIFNGIKLEKSDFISKSTAMGMLNRIAPHNSYREKVFNSDVVYC